LTNPALRIAATDWIRGLDIEWSLACRWHGSNSLRAQQQGGAGPDWLEQHLRHSLNVLDRQLFGAAYCKHKRRIERVVVLEYAYSVGWHAHGLFAVPSGLHPTKIAKLQDRIWRHQMQDTKHGTRKLDYFWHNERSGEYLGYILKHTWKYQDEFHGDKDRGFLSMGVSYIKND
jgi:hypothetical protein